MQKKFLRYLKEMKKELTDQKAIEALSQLEESLNENPPIETAKSPAENSELSVPQEMIQANGALALFTDGACRGNPGPGAWGALIQNPESEIVWYDKDFDKLTTNNKMELTAVIKGLEKAIELYDEHNYAFTQPLYLYSDSKYVLDGIRSWVPGWKARGWKKADKKAPENLELWQKLDGLTQAFTELKLNWVKGHSGHPQNDYVDALANQALDQAGY